MASTIDQAFNEALQDLEAHYATAPPADTAEEQATPNPQPDGNDGEAQEGDQEDPGGQDETGDVEPDEETEDAPDGGPLEVTEDTVVRLPDGQEMTVKDGLLRQADYTRKTQELAEQRRQLEAEANQMREMQTRIETWLTEKTANPAGWATEIISGAQDPTGTLALAIRDLASQGKLDPKFVEAFGIEAGPVAERASNASLETRLMEMERRLQETQQQAEVERRQTAIFAEYERQWQHIKQAEDLTFEGPTAERNAQVELLKFAREREITDLVTAYAAMAYERAKTARPEARKTAKDVVERKRAARAISPTGTGSAPTPRDPKDLEALIRESMAELENQSAR